MITLDKWAFKKEIELVHDVITHPSGMHIELLSMLYIRPCNSNGQILYEVGLEIDDNRFDHKTFTDPMKAAEEFVKLRFAHELGIDVEK